MRTQMKMKVSMGMAAAFLMAMTSTLSAQAAAVKPGISGPSSSAQVTADNVGFTHIRPITASDGFQTTLPLMSGWCGTDPKPAVQAHLRARVHLQLVAVLLASGTDLSPGGIAMKAAAIRRWYLSTIDVLPV